MINKKVLVIGSNSFSGSFFIKYLIDRGYQVLGCSRSNEKQDFFLPYKWTKDKSLFDFFLFDINKDIKKIEHLIAEKKIEYIVNFAAQSMVGESWENPEDWFQTNAVALSKLISRIKSIPSIKKYVHVTTPEVYGNCLGFVSEDQRINPSTPYASSRVASDLILRNFYDAFSFPYVATRASNVFGPGQQLYRIIPKTIMSILLNKKICLHGDGLSTRSFIYMEDVCIATEKLMLHGTSGETYHISTDELISIKDLVKMICSKLNVNFHDYVEYTEDRIGKDSSYQLNSDKIRSSLNGVRKPLLMKA